MHHYGEQYTKAEIDKQKAQFTITLQNHVTGAKLTLTGPLMGVFESNERTVDQNAADNLGRELAHFLRRVLA